MKEGGTFRPAYLDNPREIAAVGGDQANFALIAAQYFSHADNGMHNIVVERTACPGETAGYGQRLAGVEVQFPCRYLDG